MKPTAARSYFKEDQALAIKYLAKCWTCSSVQEREAGILVRARFELASGEDMVKRDTMCRIQGIFATKQ